MFDIVLNTRQQDNHFPMNIWISANFDIFCFNFQLIISNFWWHVVKETYLVKKLHSTIKSQPRLVIKRPLQWSLMIQINICRQISWGIKHGSILWRSEDCQHSFIRILITCSLLSPAFAENFVQNTFTRNFLCLNQVKWNDEIITPSCI